MLLQTIQVKQNNEDYKLEIWQLVEYFLRYGLVPFISLVGTLLWHLYTKVDDRVKILESKFSEAERSSIEIKTGFVYISRDIKDIKDSLNSLAHNKPGGKSGR